MTITELKNEILYRCGEGYENWGDRAEQAFRASVAELIGSNIYSGAEYHGLISQGSYTASGGETSLEISALLGANYELIRFMEATLVRDTDTYRADLASYAEHRAALLNTRLSNDSKTWYLTNDETGTFVNFGEALVLADEIFFTAIAWHSDFFNDGDVNASDFFSEYFLQSAISMAVEKLQRELKA